MIAPPPTPILREVIGELVDLVLKLVAVEWPPGTLITSWYRDPAHNKAEGCDEESQHLLGLAFDIVVPDRDQQLARLRRAGILAFPSPRGNIHVQSRLAGTSTAQLLRHDLIV